MEKNLDRHEQANFSLKNRLIEYLEDCFGCFQENSMALEEDLITYAQENTFKLIGAVIVVVFAVKKYRKIAK